MIKASLMLNKKLIKDIQSLSEKKHRAALNLFVAEGPKIVGELLDLVPGQVDQILALPQWIEQNQFRLKGINTTEVKPQELERISHLKTPNEVLALIKIVDALPPFVKGLVLYLDTIQDPGNLGTIIRIADWFGLEQVVCSAGCADVYNPKVVQSTMASIARIRVFYDEAESWLSAQQVPVYAAALGGSPIRPLEKNADAILVIGNESKGIRPEIMERATEKLTIPKRGGAESLNAAVATGIIISHLLS
jgi:RNA methyltransferase, TrmH family